MKYLIGVVVVALLAGVYFWQDQSSPPGVEGEGQGSDNSVFVEVFTVAERPFTDRISALGTLRAWESVDITPSVSQIVTEIRFEDGDRVERGDVLAVLKQESEQASLRELQATLTEAQREVRRLENLARQNQVAQTELDKSRTQEEVTGYKIEELRARIADRTIKAPFSGVLGLREVSEGALVSPGQRLTTLDDISRMRLDFSVPATRLAFLRVGSQVEATTPAFGRAFPGEISAVGSRVDPVARSITARATIDNSEGRLRPGLLMEVVLLGDERIALLVPEESLQSRSINHYVWVVEGAQARKTEVEVGGRSPGWVEITAGLQTGATVVRHGVGKLRGNNATVRLEG